MKSLHRVLLSAPLAAATALGLVCPSAVRAGQVLPATYAKTYCNLRSLGVSAQEAASAAMDAAYINTGTSPVVTINGKVTRVDVMQAAQAVVELCPGLTKS